MRNTSADDRLKGPLSGVRVIEMGQLVAGPFVGSRMADFGAEVSKVESPGQGDAMRRWGHHRYKDRGLWWPVLARNKKTVSASTSQDHRDSSPTARISTEGQENTPLNVQSRKYQVSNGRCRPNCKALPSNRSRSRIS